MNAIHKFFKRREHMHIVRLVDMAVCNRERYVVVTGWKWKCVLCGKEIWAYNDSAAELIDAGKKHWEIFVWLSNRKKESEQ